MNGLEAEVRARHLTAVLEEAVGEGVPADLAARVAHRLHAVPRRQVRPSLLVAACGIVAVGVVFAVAQMQKNAASGFAPLQDPGQDPVQVTADAIEVTVRCVANGAAVARIAAGKDTGARRFEGRQLGWRVRDRDIDTLEALARALKRVRADPSSYRASAEAGGERELLPLVISPGAGARFGDVIDSTDAAMAAGFSEIRWQGVDTPWIVPKSVEQAVVDGGRLIVPQAKFFEPDEDPSELRPVFDLHQDGRIVLAGAVTLFAPAAGRPDDLAAVRAQLLELRTSLASKGELRPRPLDQQERLQVPFLVRIDRWTEWSQVRRFLALALDAEVGFWKLEVAVSARDHEADLRGSGR